MKDVHDHLQIGQIVKVKVIDINDQGKINLSIKRVQTEEKNAEEREPAPRPQEAARPQGAELGVVAPPSGDLSFEEKLKKFMQASDSKNADKRRNTERKQHARRK